MKITEIQESFKLLGIRRVFRPYIEPESGRIMLKVRKPAQIVDGRLHGSEIDLYSTATFRVWTNQKRKAQALALRHKLRVRLLDGEAELFVPAALADLILPVSGAKTRRDLTPEQIKTFKSRLMCARNNPNSRKNAQKNEVPCIEGAKGALMTPPNPVTPIVSGERPILGIGGGSK